jgi:hypothetical protein
VFLGSGVWYDSCRDDPPRSLDFELKSEFMVVFVDPELCLCPSSESEACPVMQSVSSTWSRRDSRGSSMPRFVFDLPVRPLLRLRLDLKGGQHPHTISIFCLA